MRKASSCGAVRQFPKCISAPRDQLANLTIFSEQIVLNCSVYVSFLWTKFKSWPRCKSLHFGEVIFEKLKTIYGFLDLLPGQHPIWQPAPPSTSLLAGFPPALFSFYLLRISFLLPSHFLSTSSVFPCYFFCISFLLPSYFFSISTSLLTKFPAKHFFALQLEHKKCALAINRSCHFWLLVLV